MLQKLQLVPSLSILDVFRKASNSLHTSGQCKVRWLLRLRKLRSSQKVETLQMRLILRVTWWENIIFFYDKRNSVFFLFLPWNYFLQRWATWLRSQLYILLEHVYIFRHKHESNIKGAIFQLRSSYLFRDKPYKKFIS